MRDYKYNCFLEDVLLYTFHDCFDMTDFYDRETYSLLYTLLEYYYNRIIITKVMNKQLSKTDVYNSVNSLEALVVNNNRINKVMFMLLCDCINEINSQYSIDTRIDFDEFYDTDNACIFYYDYSDALIHRNEFAFYDFSYCKINLSEYVRQYEKHDIYYYNAYEYDY